MITVNGKSFEPMEGMTVADFLDQQGYPATRIAVEMNGDILPKAAYGQTVLSDGDVLEVVSFVGGG